VVVVDSGAAEVVVESGFDTTTVEVVVDVIVAAAVVELLTVPVDEQAPRPITTMATTRTRDERNETTMNPRNV